MATTITPELFSFLVDLIMQKKELVSIERRYVQKRLEETLKHNTWKIPETLTERQLPKNKAIKEIVSQVRGQLREVYGVFKREDTIIPKEFNTEELNQLLVSHQSSYERIDYYETIYANIFAILEEQGLEQEYSLMDLACGYNPLSYDYLPRIPKKVFVGDLSTTDMELIQSFFDARKIPGTAIYLDLLEESAMKKISTEHYDVCFLFKALDSLEAIKRHSSKALLDKLAAKFVVVSFALKSIGGKNKIGDNKRWWFEGFCKAQGWSFETFSVENELFYVVKKQ